MNYIIGKMIFTFATALYSTAKKSIFLFSALIFVISLNADEEMSDRVRLLEERITELEKKEPLEAEVIQLKFIEAGPKNLSSKDDKSWLRIKLRVTNKMGRTTQSVKGYLIFSDSVGIPWWKINLDVTQILDPDAAVEWVGRIDYDESSAPHIRARQSLANEVRAEIKLNKVTFLDGSELLFGENNNTIP